MDTPCTILTYGAVVWLNVVHVFYFFVVAFVVACCYVRDIVMQWRIQLGFPMIHSVHDVFYSMNLLRCGGDFLYCSAEENMVLSGRVDFRIRPVCSLGMIGCIP